MPDDWQIEAKVSLSRPSPPALCDDLLSERLGVIRRGILLLIRQGYLRAVVLKTLHDDTKVSPSCGSRDENCLKQPLSELFFNHVGNLFMIKKKIHRIKS